MGVKTAYLHAPMNAPINPPEGCEDKDGPRYGLKQSWGNWDWVLHDCFVGNEFTQNTAAVFMQRRQMTGR